MGMPYLPAIGYKVNGKVWETIAAVSLNATEHNIHIGACCKQHCTSLESDVNCRSGCDVHTFGSEELSVELHGTEICAYFAQVVLKSAGGIGLFFLVFDL